MFFNLNWPYANDKPSAKGQLKTIPTDFQVNELVSEKFSGSGEHQLIKIEKSGVTTEDVVKNVSRLINKPVKLISYAGLKDKQALTTQWLSVHLPGESVEGIEQLEGSGWRVIDSARHNKKLRPGYLTGNQFIIRLREISGVEDALKRLEQIKITGVPNYFGEQRFGRDAGNLPQADALLNNRLKVKDRFIKGIYFSAARSWIFNNILARRVASGTWNTALQGDVFQLAGSHSIFTTPDIDEVIKNRIVDKDISPASPLPGKGAMMATAHALECIEAVYAEWSSWIVGLEHRGLELAWRSNILHLEDVSYTIEEDTLVLNFTLPPGAYATTVLREVVDYS